MLPIEDLEADLILSLPRMILTDRQPDHSLLRSQGVLSPVKEVSRPLSGT
jgi:hypothetical protein